MQLVDIGANLTHESFRHDFDAVLERAWTHGVIQMVVTGASHSGSDHALELARAHPGKLFATAGVHATAVQHDFSVLHDSAGVLAVCERHDLASVNRGPLAMGLLTGKYHASSRLGTDDVRGIAPEWMHFFRDGRPAPEWLARVDAVRDVLRGDGRTHAQGAVAYLWARSGRTIPIPGCRTVAQVEENAGALAHGPLPADQLAELDKILTG